jgi:hypothetical protein
MKDQLESPRELNAPTEMVVRVTFALAIGALACGLLLTIFGVIAWQLRLSALGLAVVGLGLIGRSWLQRRVDAPCESALEDVWDNPPALDHARAAELMTLLEQWEAQEEKRGTPDFDPWALQTLRNQIRQVVESDPGLEELFSRLRQVA